MEYCSGGKGDRSALECLREPEPWLMSINFKTGAHTDRITSHGEQSLSDPGFPNTVPQGTPLTNLGGVRDAMTAKEIGREPLLAVSWQNPKHHKKQWRRPLKRVGNVFRRPRLKHSGLVSFSQVHCVFADNSHCCHLFYVCVCSLFLQIRAWKLLMRWMSLWSIRDLEVEAEPRNQRHKRKRKSCSY